MLPFELTGTVDSFPVLTGEVAMETALRLVSGQALPRVVSTPQALITKDNVARYQDAGDNLRAVLTRRAYSEQEISIMRGVFATFDRYSRKNPRGKAGPDQDGDGTDDGADGA